MSQSAGINLSEQLIYLQFRTEEDDDDDDDDEDAKKSTPTQGSQETASILQILQSLGAFLRATGSPNVDTLSWFGASFGPQCHDLARLL